MRRYKLNFYLQSLSISLALGFSSIGHAQTDFHAGPLFDQFPLTLDIGHRTEAIGPFFYNQTKESEQTWAIPPLFSHDTDPIIASREDDFLYPLLTYEYFGKEYRWQLVQLISFSGGQDPQSSTKKRFTIFPFYFQQRSPNSNDNYTAFVPFYGHMQDHLFRDDIFFILFPVYSETRKKDVVTDNYLYPFFHVRHGDKLSGWQFWPLVGHEHKDPTTRTNNFGETEIVGGHEKFFALWPIYFHQTTGIGTDDPQKGWGVLPFYDQFRSPKRDSTTVLWPFFSWIDDRGQKYREQQIPWPFIVIARGEGKTTTRVWPLFGRSHNDSMESDFYLWPFYRYKHIHAAPLDEQRTRILFFLFGDTKEKNTETGKTRRQLDLLPLFTYRRDFDGGSRLQILALIEPVLPNNRGIERNWSPLWSLWRAENNPASGATSQSLLWNFYRRDATPTSKKCSLLFGLFQYQSDSEMRRVRLFYVPVFKSHKPAK